MKKLLLIFCFALFSKLSVAQQPAPLIWGCSAFQDSLWATDTLTWLPSINVEPIVTGSVIAGLNGLAYDPTTYKCYAILNITSSARDLAEIDLQTGVCTVKGNLGDKFSSITFDKFGQLYGCTGDGANNPETLYKIDKATATTTLVFQMGNGADGEVICYNRYDDKMYHWSGNGTVVYESWPVGSTSYAPTNIPISGTSGGETFGALCLKPGGFIISNINSNFLHASATGVYGNVLSNNPDDLRGIVMPPRFATSTLTLCANSNSLEIFSNCLQQYDSVYYYWGDGNVTQLLASSASTGAAIHTYTSSGTYTLDVKLYNGAVAKSTFTTYTVVVNSLPNVTLSGSTNLCPGDSVTLSGSGGGTSQWYEAGVAISGATLSTLNVTSPGWYNMLKTNLNGCSDSSSTGLLVIQVSSPTITTSDTTICSGNTVTLSASGADTYTFTGGATVVSPTITTSYSVTGTSTAGCVSSNTAVATVSVNALPSVSITANNATICIGESALLTAEGASLYTWSTTETTNTLEVSPAATTSYTVSGTNAEGCTNTATISLEVSECTSIAENKTNVQALRVIPNPGSGKFFIENTIENTSILVYNSLGALVIKTVATNGKTYVDLSNYQSGIYFVCLNKNNKILGHVKLIKE